MFKSFIKADEKMVDIETSFDMLKNWNKIKSKFAGPDGGKRYFTPIKFDKFKSEWKIIISSLISYNICEKNKIGK